jgi:hypothetical protein
VAPQSVRAFEWKDSLSSHEAAGVVAARAGVISREETCESYSLLSTNSSLGSLAKHRATPYRERDGHLRWA